MINNNYRKEEIEKILQLDQISAHTDEWKHMAEYFNYKYKELNNGIQEYGNGEIDIVDNDYIEWFFNNVAVLVCIHNNDYKTISLVKDTELYNNIINHIKNNEYDKNLIGIWKQIYLKNNKFTPYIIREIQPTNKIQFNYTVMRNHILLADMIENMEDIGKIDDIKPNIDESSKTENKFIFTTYIE